MNLKGCFQSYSSLFGINHCDVFIISLILSKIKTLFPLRMMAYAFFYGCIQQEITPPITSNETISIYYVNKTSSW